jgi:hypothetical protein
MSFHPYKLFLPILFLLALQPLSGQTVIWLENFSGAPPAPGWTDNFTDCDGTAASFFGVMNNRYEVTDMEGSPCCPLGPQTGGGNNNEWTTNAIDIMGFCNVTISVDYGTNVEPFECSAGGPFFACTGNPFTDDGHDQMVFEYSIDGGAFVQFGYLCGGGTGTATVAGLSGSTISVRVRPANKSVSETYWFDDVEITGSMPTVNPIADIPGCAGSPIPVTFTGTGSPAPTFSWTNDNTAIGLGASGTGQFHGQPTGQPCYARDCYHHGDPNFPGLHGYARNIHDYRQPTAFDQ